MGRIAITDGMDPSTVNILRDALPHDVVEQHYTEDELVNGAISDFDAIVVRSATKLTSQNFIQREQIVVHWKGRELVLTTSTLKQPQA